MTGIEKITGRILSDAQAEIDTLMADAKAQAADIAAKYANEARKVYADAAAKGKNAAEDRETHLGSSAQMEARKMILAAKQEMLDAAYADAEKRLNSLPDKAMVQTLAALAQKASVTGKEEIILNANVAKRLGAEVVEKANSKGLNLTLSKTTGNFAGGLLLSDGDVEVNCTFDTLVRLTRNETAGEVAKVLFG
ncbi:MAG: V-type ATP synthase subunit E [Oscillospiraceae bacterium]|nr:V-type ATP synthase subunit E [Oscillospiraceae bacterium]